MITVVKPGEGEADGKTNSNTVSRLDEEILNDTQLEKQNINVSLLKIDHSEERLAAMS